MKCEKCGAELKDDQRFCGICGQEAVSAPVPEPNAVETADIGAVTNPTEAEGSGAAMDPMAPMWQPPILKKKIPGYKKFLTTVCMIGGMVNGVLSVILGSILFCFSNGWYESNERYGGDAYTGIQNAAAQTANNVQDLADIVKFGIGFLLIVFGFAMIWTFALKWLRTKNQTPGT